jgi:hypothetical protein
MFRLWQRSKKWYKKTKVDPEDPNKFNEYPWEINTRNRDRPTGHTRAVYKNRYDQGTKKQRFYGRLNKHFHINEDL